MPSASKLLRQLRTHNVLVSGPPGTGKTHVVNEVARRFKAPVGGPPVFIPGVSEPFPSMTTDDTPAPTRTDRRVWFVTFHQEYQHKSFVGGLELTARDGVLAPQAMPGVALQAIAHARKLEGASLIVIDEINRGNVPRIFGELISVLDNDKRLDDEGRRTPTSLTLDLPHFGQLSMPRHVYFLGAFNTADVSVAPLDIAFRRRFREVSLQPSSGELASHLGIGGPAGESVPPAPADAKDVYRLAARLLDCLNERVADSAGGDYCVGHGFFWGLRNALTTDLALGELNEAWRDVFSQLAETFRGADEDLANVLRVEGAPVGYPYSLAVEALEPRLRVKRAELRWVDFVHLAEAAYAHVPLEAPTADLSQTAGQPTAPEVTGEAPGETSTGPLPVSE